MATYYVKNGGNDGLDGLTDATAWSTLVKVESFGAAPGFDPGDTICLKRGSIWYDNLYIPCSGSAAGQITYTAYDEGALPIITGRGAVTGWSTPGNWTQVGATDVWYLEWAFGTAVRPRIWLDGVEKQSAPNAASVTAALPHFYDSSPTPDRLYVYSPAPATPATTYTTLQESTARNECVYVLKKDYITFRNLDIRGGTYSLYIVESSGIIVENCTVGLEASRHGIYICYYAAAHEFSSDNGIIRNCLVDSGYRFYDDWVFTDPYFNLDGINIRNADNWKIYDNIILDWNHCGLVFEVLWAVSGYQLNNIEAYGNDISAPDLNYGHGVSVYIIEGLGTNNKIHHNNIHDIPVRNQFAGSGLEVYYNIINNVFGATGSAGVAQGINISCDGTVDVYPSKMKIYNNVIANCEDEGIRLANYWGAAGIYIEENEFINNIIYNCDNTDGYQLSIQEEIGPIENKVLDNIYKNNLFYKAGITDLVYYRGAAMTVTEFNAENGNAFSEVIEDNITGDPLFISSSDFQLQALSPAINSGIDVGKDQDFIGTAVPQGFIPDIGAYEWFAAPTVFSNITLVSTPACYDPVDPTIVSRWVATECPINFRLLRRDWYVISCAESGGYLSVNIYGTFAGADGDIISVYDLTTNSMYTGTITDSSTDPVLVTSILWVDGMDIKYLNDHTLYAGYYFEGRLTINGVVEPLTIIASPDSFGYADLDVSAILRTKTRVGKLTNYLNRIMADTYKSGNFTLEYRGRWWGSAEAWTQEGSITSPPSTVVWYYAECVRSIEQGCNLSEYVPTDLSEAKWLNQFETPVYWYGLPFDISFILPEMAELSPAIELTVTTKVYDSENFQLGGDIVEYVDVDDLEGYVNNLSVDSTLIPVGASYFTVEITAP